MPSNLFDFCLFIILRGIKSIYAVD